MHFHYISYFFIIAGGKNGGKVVILTERRAAARTLSLWSAAGTHGSSVFLARTLCKLTPLWAFTLGIRGLQTAASIKAIYKLSPLQLWASHLAPEHVAFYRLCFNCRVNIQVRRGAGESGGRGRLCLVGSWRGWDAERGKGEADDGGGSPVCLHESSSRVGGERKREFFKILNGCDIFGAHANGTLMCHTPVYHTLSHLKKNNTLCTSGQLEEVGLQRGAGQQMVKCGFVPITINEWPLLAKRRTTGPNALFMVSALVP